MRTPIQLRLSLTTLAVLLLGMGLAAVLTWLAVEQLYLKTQQENLLAQAQLTASALQDSEIPIDLIEPYSQTSNVQPGIHTRLLGEQGAVIVSLPITENDIPLQVPLAENAAPVPPSELLLRPEIQSALNGTPATAIRRVASADNRRVLYAGTPIFSPDGIINGIVYLATPLPPARLPSNLIWQLLGAVAIAALLAGTTGTLLSRRISRPLENLVTAASAVAAGDLDQRVPENNDIHELHSLGEAFNNMTLNLRCSEQAKTAFIADVTHELRTPLTVIHGTIETLEDGTIDDLENRGPLIQSMQAETRRLIRLVNDLLILTRADAGVLHLKIKPVNLESLIQSRCKNLSALTAHRQITFDIRVEGQTGVSADEDRLIQIMDNLLNNAIRHSPDQSTIFILIHQEEKEVRCTVRDQGNGIPSEHLPYIFDRFYRVEPSRDRQSGGSGLGLSIVRSLLSAQGGRIKAESTQGQGAAFTFWLPASNSCFMDKGTDNNKSKMRSEPAAN
ncbi:MAG: HAMP domain-containing protein [Anaerolineaceae bacterium]|nr:HAMP domain-containing protein [Anaerolineaceae bacterium]